MVDLFWHQWPRQLIGLLLVLLLVLLGAACSRRTATPVAQNGPTPSATPPPGVVTSDLSPAFAPTVTAEPASGTATVTPRPGSTAPPPTVPLNVTRLPQGYLPIVSGPPLPSATPTRAPTNTPPPTPTPTIDFAAVRSSLRAQGDELGFVKIGFHTGGGGNRNGIGTWMSRLDAAGVPFFLKSADDSGPLVEAQALIRRSGVPHTLVFRRSGDAYDTPEYELPAGEAARRHWALHMAAWPPELDPELVWIETLNEVDKNRSEWLAEFALVTAELALADGFRWAAFGWSSGEPEPHQWQQPAMLAFLRLAGNNPDRLAVALHEYSYIENDIADQYPFKVGRFQQLFQVCDANGIPRPTVLITEWGWEYQSVPSTGAALADIAWAAAMYAPYPQIKGAAIWYLGGGFGDVSEATQRLIAPLTEYALGNYFVIPLPPAQAAIEPDRYAP